MNAIAIDKPYQRTTTAMPDPAITFRGVVCAWHLDHMAHMNVQHYAGMFDHASWVLLAMLGLDAVYFRENDRGMAALEQSVRFQRELLAGEAIEISSGIAEIRDKTMRIHHTMRKLGGEIAAHTTILAVHLDTRSRKSMPLPLWVRERAGAWIVTPDGSR
jgi:acyl-CoA thioester hydrolase